MLSLLRRESLRSTPREGKERKSGVARSLEGGRDRRRLKQFCGLSAAAMVVREVAGGLW